MAISTETPYVVREGTGATFSFSFSFPIQDADQLLVTHIDTSGTETVIAVGTGATNYSLDSMTFPGAGTITYPADSGTELPALEFLRIERTVSLTQDTTFTTQGGYNPKTMTNLADKLVMNDQQLQEQLDRAALVDKPDGSGNVFDGLAGYTFVVNTAETAFELVDGFQGPAGANGSDGVAGPPGPWEFLETGALTGATVDTASAGDSSHVALCVVLTGVHVDTDNAQTGIQFNVGGVQTTSYDNLHIRTHSGNSVIVADTTRIGLSPNGGATKGQGAATNEEGMWVIYISSPSSTTERKYATFHGVYTGGDGGTVVVTGGGAWEGGTGAISSLRFMNGLGGGELFDGGNYYLYGLKAETGAAVEYLSSYHAGTIASNEVIMRFVAPEAMTIAADLPLSVLDADTAATAETILEIDKNDVAVGTATVAISGTTATFDSSATAITLAAGDVLTIEGPASADSTLADVAVTVRATRDVT
jgi:hypothetical protein